MGYTYTPTYYSSLQDSITSICKNILPFSFKKKRLPAIVAAEQKLSEQQSGHLKWQQESFHQILKLIGLCKEGIVPETQVSAFRAHLLETLIASPLDYEQPTILRDKLIFLQELLYAKCITEDEYHCSKRPLLQRLAVQGVEIEAKNVIVKGGQMKKSNEEWSEIDLKDEKSLLSSKGSSSSKNKPQHGSSSASSKQIKGAASSVLGFISSTKSSKVKEEKSEKEIFKKSESLISTENPFWHNQFIREREKETKSVLMSESLASKTLKTEKQSGGDRAKKKPFKTFFQREQKGEERGESDNHDVARRSEEKSAKSGKKQPWLFKKWKKNDGEDDETDPLPLGGERSDGEDYFGRLVENPMGEGPDTKEIKRKLHPCGAPSDFFVDKVLGDKIKKELSKIQTQVNGENENVEFTDEQIEAISTRLPVDMDDLMKFLPRSWCDCYGDVVLDVVKKEFKDHVAEMGNSSQRRVKERQCSNKWATFDDDDENFHPNLFIPKDNNRVFDARTLITNSSIDKGFKYNPFFEI
ncbi:hypothetical protein Leryth_021006 [Lithospermum erythrorhizon]|nr:hypothetical protein Leryth_021006 [Lithospermum erythrorhizon]